MPKLTDPYRRRNRRALDLAVARCLESKGIDVKLTSKEIARKGLKVERRQGNWKLVAKKVVEPVLNRRGALRSPCGGFKPERRVADDSVCVEGLGAYHGTVKSHIPGGRFVAHVSADSRHLIERELPELPDND